ncbi:MAG: hypothetical protein AB1847_13190 [bacterium]
MITPRKRVSIGLYAGIFLLISMIACLGIENVRAQGSESIRAQGIENIFMQDFDLYEEVEQSYHGQIGYGTGLGMVDKWCPLSYFKFSEEGGIDGWISRGCDECHIGARWNPNKPQVNCLSCHPEVNQVSSLDYVVVAPTIQKCYTCHEKETEKRGDLFDPGSDIHLAVHYQSGCQYCHPAQNHQIAKGEALDTSEPTMTDPVVSCTMSGCHPSTPHQRAVEDGKIIAEANRLDQHCKKVACETCHTDTRSRSDQAMLKRDWTQFIGGKPLTCYHEAGWVPQYKWYDAAGPSPDHKYVPILDYAERKDFPGAKIYPFNVITVTWFIKSEGSELDDIIIAKKVKAAGKPVDPQDPSSPLVTTEADMRAYDDPGDADSEPDYPDATAITREITFNLSHSIVSTDKVPACTDCHGKTGRRLLNWEKLGYTSGDPRKKRGRRMRRKRVLRKILRH